MNPASDELCKVPEGSEAAPSQAAPLPAPPMDLDPTMLRRERACQFIHRVKRWSWRGLYVASIAIVLAIPVALIAPLFPKTLFAYYMRWGSAICAWVSVGALSLAALANLVYMGAVFVAARFSLAGLLLAVFGIGALSGLIVTGFYAQAIVLGVIIWVFALIHALANDPT